MKPNLQKINPETQKLRLWSWECYKKVYIVIYYQSLLFVSDVIGTDLTCRHHDNILAGHFSLKKLLSFGAKNTITKLFSMTLSPTSKTVTYHLRLRRMSSIESIIVDRLTKIIYYRPVKIIIDTQRLVEMIIDVVVKYHGLANLIISNTSSPFNSKFWTSFCYLGIKHRRSISFHLQIDGQTERQNISSLIQPCWPLHSVLSTSFTYHCWNRTPWKKGGYTNILR